jgi:ATP-dependent helicase/nuclease subunit A
LLAVLWPFVEEQMVLPRERSILKSDTLRGGELRRVPADWRPPSLAPLSGEEPIPLQAQVPMPAFDWAGETARQIGIWVHARLQTLSPGIAAADIHGQTDNCRRWLASRGVPAERLAEAARRATDALLNVVEDARGRWILAHEYLGDARELALSGIVDGRIANVVIDRMFIDAGTRWIIDYKTSQHGGGDPQRFLDSEVERYQAQLNRYAALARKLGPEPIRLGLYFPLMRAWREWSVES